MATASSKSSRLRARLRDLAKRRREHSKEDAKLTRDIKKALAEADGEISVSEQANLLGMHRTTLYRVYKD